MIMLAVNEDLDSILLSGEKGSGKSLLARGFAALLPRKRRVDIPLHTTEDRLLGGVDLEYALKHGEKKVQAGLLAAAHQNIVFADDMNLMADSAVHAIVNAVTSRQVEAEREGLSISYPSDSILVAAMNPEEGGLSAGVLDRFGLFVSMTCEHSVEHRRDIIRSALAYERDPEGFSRSKEQETLQLQELIITAKGYLSRMNISGQLLELAAWTTLIAQCRGHRAD
ncbi:ATP-binding protein, partial [Paenibacillus sepulcri]|nr:ATP-binding protein [Paenibacillus sepulcri]